MKRWKKVLALILVVNVLSGCAMQELLQVTNEENSMEESETKETITEAEIEEDLHSVESEKLSKEKKSIHEQIADRIGKTTQASMETRPLLIERVSETKVADITPCVTPYTIEAGLVCNAEPEGEPDMAHYDSLSAIKLGHLFAEELALFLE